MHGRKIKVKIHCKFDGWVIGSKSEKKTEKLRKPEKKITEKTESLKTD